MIFDLLKLTKSWKFKKIARFRTKQGPFTQNFAKQPNFFLFPKFLELSLTIKNPPPKVKTQKWAQTVFFWETLQFGTNCTILYTKQTYFNIFFNHTSLQLANVYVILIIRNMSSGLSVTCCLSGVEITTEELSSHLKAYCLCSAGQLEHNITVQVWWSVKTI